MLCNNREGVMKITFDRAKLSCLLLALLLCAGCSSGEIAPVSDPCFQLNGHDYPAQPIVQDFLDRGWKLGEAAGYTGNYSPEDGPYDVIPSSYYLTDGEQQVKAELSVDELRDRVKPNNCHLTGLSVYGSDVDSFAFDGHELTTTDPEQLAAWFGEPGSQKTESVGTMCNYEINDGKLTQLQIAFPATLDTTGQIFLVFDLND